MCPTVVNLICFLCRYRNPELVIEYELLFVCFSHLCSSLRDRVWHMFEFPVQKERDFPIECFERWHSKKHHSSIEARFIADDPFYWCYTDIHNYCIINCLHGFQLNKEMGYCLPEIRNKIRSLYYYVLWMKVVFRGKCSRWWEKLVRFVCTDYWRILFKLFSY